MAGTEGGRGRAGGRSEGIFGTTLATVNPLTAYFFNFLDAVRGRLLATPRTSDAFGEQAAFEGELVQDQLPRSNRRQRGRVLDVLPPDFVINSSDADCPTQNYATHPRSMSPSPRLWWRRGSRWSYLPRARGRRSRTIDCSSMRFVFSRRPASPSETWPFATRTFGDHRADGVAVVEIVGECRVNIGQGDCGMRGNNFIL